MTQADAVNTTVPTAARPVVTAGAARSSLREPRSSRRVGLASFLVVATGLLLHDRSLFRVRIWEVGDAAANSLLVDNAKHLHLLVGHYSRVGFNHPGPAVLYLQALGEWVFYDLLHVAAGPYNGQVVAVVLLEAAAVGAVVSLVHSWAGGWVVGPVAAAVVLLWYLHHPFSLTSTWMPLVVVAPFLLLLVSAASVASGRTQHLWLLTGVACLLVHAHVEFALFSPVLCLWALAAWAAIERIGPLTMLRRDPRAWWTSLAIVLVFAFPIALNTVLHYPGEIPKYVTYSSAGPKVTPSLAQVLHYSRQFWAGDSSVAKYVPGLLVGAALLTAVTAPRRLRRPLLLLTGTCLLAEALFLVYARVGIDDLSQSYVGLFSWSVPLGLLLVVAVALTAHLARSAVLAVVAAASAAVVGVVAFTQPGFDLRPEGLAALPEAIRAVEQAAGPAVTVLDVGPGIAPFIDGTGLLIALERDKRPVCVAEHEFTVQVTARRICTQSELGRGQRVTLRDPVVGTASQVPGGLSEITLQPRG